MNIQPKTQRFDQNILTKYQIYNSIFITLPFDNISNTGVLMPLLKSECEKGFGKGLTPIEIIDSFFAKYQEGAGAHERIDLLFKFIQYINAYAGLFLKG